MATESAYPGDDPHRLLSNTRELAQRVREAQRATWLPLLLLAVVTFASIPVYRYGGHHDFGTCTEIGPGPRACAVFPDAEFVPAQNAGDIAAVEQERVSGHRAIDDGRNLAFDFAVANIDFAAERGREATEHRVLAKSNGHDI